jgi:hypothetical protein
MGNTDIHPFDEFRDSHIYIDEAAFKVRVKISRAAYNGDMSGWPVVNGMRQTLQEMTGQEVIAQGPPMNCFFYFSLSEDKMHMSRDVLGDPRWAFDIDFREKWRRSNIT